MIYKLQMPLNAVNSPLVLAYREGKYDQRMIPVTDELKKLFAGDLKIFVDAEPWDGGLRVFRRLRRKYDW